MEQNPITVVTEVLENHFIDLEKYLKPIGMDIKNNKMIQFSTLKTLHYCCFIVIQDDKPPPGIEKAKPILVFEANIDGKVKNFLTELIIQYPEFMHTVYGYCLGYSKAGGALTNDELLAFLLANERGANTFYISYPGQTREIIEYQNNLRSTIETYIDDNRTKLIKLQSAEIKQSIIEHLNNAVTDFNTKKPASLSTLTKIGQKLRPYSNWVILGIVAVFLLFVFMIVGEIGLYFIVGLVAAYIGFLLFKEIGDKEDSRLQWDSGYIIALQDTENRQEQNHLSSIIYVKPGIFRLFTLKTVLFFIGVVAKLFATQGNLSGIVTIHFARWLVLPGKGNERHRLLFFSNYDGSWENYLGEFIDHASIGLTAIWSNTESNAKLDGLPGGFPKTRLLGVFSDKWSSIFPAGARDEQRFKAFARNSQRPELIWYSAYPDLSVKNIGNNMKIHEGIFSDLDLSAWLKRL